MNSKDLLFSTKKTQTLSTYNVEEDIGRLKMQADVLLEFDKQVIDKALHFLQKNSFNKILNILDIGCANGYVTNSRFGMLDRVSVLGVDKNKSCIDEANVNYSKKHIKFISGDIEQDDLNLGKFDLIFCSYLMPHLANSQFAMQKLWNVLGAKGVLIVRGGDDGWKINYPDNEELDFLVSITNKLNGSSDRTYGRKIYAQMKNLIPKPDNVELKFLVESTAGMTSEQRNNFFTNYYSFRMQYAERLAKKIHFLEEDRQLYEKLYNITERQKENFINNENLFSFNTHVTGVAYK